MYKVVNNIGMITEKGKFGKWFSSFFQHHMLLVHIEKVSKRQFQHVSTIQVIGQEIIFSQTLD